MSNNNNVKFQSINRGYNTTFVPNQLSIGVVVPIENYSNSSVPTMTNHLEKVRYIEKLGFKALWVRDVPFHVPSFGDAGQTFDPFTYLGYLAGQTTEIALGVSSIALPLHHPLHVAKSAATIDQLSDGRLILGIASGDRYDEYPAMGIQYDKRSELFRDAFNYIKKSQDDFPSISSNYYGTVKGDIDILPKPSHRKIPMLITGFSQQSIEWNAEHADGWMYYPRDVIQQKNRILEWRALITKTHEYGKPFMQPLYIDLQKNDNFKPQSIHLGLKIGINYLVDYFHHLQDIGVNHIAINLRFNTMGIEHTLDHLANKLLTNFHLKNTN